MTEDQKPQDNLTDEFRNLGKNLADTARAAWDNPEREKLQQEIETGLAEMGSILKNEYDNLRESPAGQRVKQDVETISERVRSSEVEQKVRSDLVSVLHRVNEELETLTNQWVKSDDPETEGQPEDNESEE